MQNSFFDEMKNRGFIFQTTEESKLKNFLSENKTPAYIGFDCTASSLHVGSLVQIMILRWLQKYGYQPIILLGGGTTKIGDPSGKDKTRSILNEEEINKNLESIKNIFAKFLEFDGDNKAIVVNNAEWLDNLGYINFLRDVGSHFSVNRMLGFESIKQRLDREQNLSFLEFNYLLLQSYDFVELNKRYNCKLQIGGSDQWGNIVSGIDLNRRLGNDDLYAFTSPLITTASGAKMGKTASGAVWLDEGLFNANDYWQFWRNTEDKDVIKFLRLFTEIDLREIEELAKLEGQDINNAKIILANEATKILHGEEKAKQAFDNAQNLFNQNNISDLPSIDIEQSSIDEGLPFFKIILEANLASSGGEARRVIRGGGGKINDEKCIDENYIIKFEDFKDGLLKLSSGKKKHAILKLKN